jgi:glutamine phosphoribosylpyrophosphate amidotransferase
MTGQKLMQTCKPKKVRDAEASTPSIAACTFEASLPYAQEVMKVGTTLRTFIAPSGSRESSMILPKLKEKSLTLLRTHFSR